MKNCLLALLLIASFCATAQVPAQMNYQGIARNSVGNVLPNKKIMVRLSVRDQGPSGNILYSEVRNVTTSSLGLFNIAIGSNGAVSATGSFANVNWNSGAKFLQVEIDPDGGTNYLNLGASPLLAVPYSLYALNAGIATPTGPAGGDLVGNYPNPTIGVDAITTTKISDAAVTNDKLAVNSVTALKIMDSTITLEKLANGVIPKSLPPTGPAGGDLTGNYPLPSVANNAITTNKIQDGSVTMPKLGPDVILALSAGGGGSPTGPAGGDLSGVYPNPAVANNAITNNKLADNSVTTSKIVDASVTNAKLANNSVNTANIVDASVTSAKLAAGVIPSTLPPNGPAGGDLTGTFPNPVVANNAINTNKIADNSITTSKIVDASVTSAKLAPGVIPTTLPPNGPAGGDLTGTFPNPVVANNAINTNKIADNSIVTSKIVDASVTLPKLGPDVITYINSTSGSGNPTGPAGGDLSGTYPNPTVANLAITTSKIADNAINTTKLADNSVTTSKIVDASVTNAKLANNAVNTINIVDASVTAAKLAAGVIPSTLPPNGPAGGDLTGTFPNPIVANNAINTAKLADNSVTTTKIVDANVTTAKLADNSVTTAKIVDSNVTNAKLAINAVNTPNIVDASVTMPKLGPDVILFMSSGPGGPPTGPAGGDLTGTYPNPTIANNAITAAKIANNAVTNAALANNAVNTQNIVDGAITSQKIANNSVTNAALTNNSVNTQNIVNGSVTANKLAPGVIPSSLPPTGAAGGDLNGNYPDPTIANSAVTTGKIANLSVTNGKLADNSVSTVKILDASVTLPKLGPDVITYINTNGGGGGGNPTGPAGGDLTGTYPNPTVANLAVTTAKLADNSVTTAKIVDGNVTNAKLATNSVGTTNIIDGSVTSAKLAAGVIPTTLPPNGPAGGDLTGTFPNPIVANNAINTAKLADNSVTTAKIVDANVTNAKLATNSVGTTNIIDANVTTAKLADNTISTIKIQDASVTLPKLGPDVIAAMGGGGGGNPTGPAGGDLSGTYPNPAIANLAVTSAKLADNSVTTAKIVDANVTTAKLADNSVTTAKIVDANVTNAKLATNSVGTTNIIDANVTTAKLADNSVTTTKIVDANVTTAKLADNTISTIKIQDASVTLPKLGPDVIAAMGGGGGGNPTGPAGGDLSGTYPNPTIANLAVTSAKLADNSVTTAKIVDANVTTAKLADNSVTTIKLVDNSVTTAKIVDANVTNAKLAANSVGTTNIIDASVTSAKLAAGVIPTTLPPNGPAGGDLTGTYPNPVVSKLQGVGVNNTTPTTGQVLKYNGSVWTPQNDATGFSLPYAGSDNSATNSFSVTNTAGGGGLEGVNSSTGANTIGVLGRISSVSAGASSAGLKGVNNSTGINGYGVWGHHAGNGIGVYGFSVNGNGIQGNSTNGSGIFGTSTNGSAGYFDISNAANSFDGVTAYTVGTGSALVGTSEQGNGLWGITYSPSTAGVLGYNIGGGEAVVGRNISSTAAAVVGRNDDVYAGVQGIGGADGATGVRAQANVDGYINGNALVAELVGAGNGNTAVFKANGANVARIDKNGKGFFNGGTQTGGADVAEYFDVEGELKNYEAGDVLVISTASDRTVEKSSSAYSTLVAGVYATKPGLLLTEKNAEQDQLDKMVPMGVIGVIPTKVCLEGGAIKRGDLIVTSSIPGVAMKADIDKVKPGQVIGKALQDYNEPGIGKINVLVSVK